MHLHAPPPRLLAALACAVLVALTACSDDASTDAQTSTNNSTTSANNGATSANNGATSTNSGTTSTNNSTTDPDEPGPLPSDDWCARALPGPAQTPSEVSLRLSKAHGTARFFGPFTSYEDVDEALADALEAWDPADPARAQTALARYADALDGVCASAALADAPASTEVVHDGAALVVKLGAEPADIPDEVDTVVLDLRAATDHPDVLDAFAQVVQDTLTPDQRIAAPSQRKVRVHNGMVDEYFAPATGVTNVYRVSTGWLPLDALEGRSAKARTLAFVVGPRLTPKLAAWVGELRLQGVAYHVGEDLHAAVAESTWVSVGDGGIWARTSMLYRDDAPWPDVIPAHARVFAPDAVLEAIAAQPLAPVQADPEAATRPEIIAFDPTEDLDRDTAITPGVVRAMLVTAHTAADHFFAFFREVGRGIDDALAGELGAVDASYAGRRDAAYYALARLAHHLHDAHVITVDAAQDATSWTAGIVGFLPAQLDHVDGLPVVAQSATPDLSPGDTIVQVNGERVEDMYARFDPTVAYATPRNGELSKGLLLSYLTGPTELTVRDLDGQERDVTVNPIGYNAYAELPSPLVAQRPSGWLDDLGQPNVLYINLNGATTSDSNALRTLIRTSAPRAEGVVLDMRGYPGTDLSAAFGWVIGASYPSPRFRTPVYEGPDTLTRVFSQYDYSGPPSGVEPFLGPVALLVSPYSQSSAENVSMGLVTSGRATIVGRQSSGSNGNITGIVLPGAFSMSFTGLHVAFSDGATFHGVGIQPDIDGSPSARDLADGIDRALVEALEHITTP